MKYAGALWTKRKTKELRNYCAYWITWDPSNGLVYEYLSRAAQHTGSVNTAIRAATSIAEIAPRDSEQLLRGAWLTLSLMQGGAASASDKLVASTWAKRFAERSLEERTDNPNTYR